jgi:hypothetical protein
MEASRQLQAPAHLFLLTILNVLQVLIKSLLKGEGIYLNVTKFQAKGGLEFYKLVK